MEIDIQKLNKIFGNHPAIKLAYLFGSQATGKAGPMSDFDFAIYLEEKDPVKCADIQFALMDKLAREFKTDRVDVVLLNLAESPDLKFNIIKDGRLVYEVDPYRVMIEPRIMNEYFDLNLILSRHKLTKTKI